MQAGVRSTPFLRQEVALVPRIRHNAVCALAIAMAFSGAFAIEVPTQLETIDAAPKLPEAALPPVPVSALPPSETEKRSLGSSAVAPRAKTKGISPSASDPAKASSFSGIIGPLAVILSLIAMLAGVVVLLARMKGGLHASLTAGGKSPAGILEVLGRYPLGGGLTLVLLKVDRRILLLSQSRNGRFGGLQLSPICELDSPEDVASILMRVRDSDSNSMTSKFASVFRSLDRQAAETIAGGDGRILTTNAPVAEPPAARRAAHGSHAGTTPRTREQTGAETAASIRHRLEALRMNPKSSGGEFAA